MRTLILIRHGKSDWATDTELDHERPLAPRGEKAARRIGKFLDTAGLVPDSAVTSTARRARSTAELVVEAGGWPCPIRATDALYDTPLDGALAVLRQTPQEISTLAAFGHEPTWSTLASALIGGGQLNVVTAAAVGLDLGIDDWRALAPGVGVLRFLIPPRLLD